MSITLEELNERLEDGLLVYQHYLPGMPGGLKLGQHYKSPFGHEGRASFNLFRHRDKGTVYFSDHATGKQGSHWQFVMDLFNVPFKEAVRLVKEDVLGIFSTGPRNEPGMAVRSQYAAKPRLALDQGPAFSISPKPRNWTATDLDYFARVGISQQTLEKYGCTPLHNYQFSKAGKQPFTVFNSEADPIYCYSFPETGHYKIRRPFNKKFPWLSNTDALKDVFGFDLLPARCQTIYLCAGQRDTMALHELTGLPCICLNSETQLLSWELYQLLSLIADDVYSVYDNDETGQRMSEKLCQEFGILSRTEPIDSSGENDLCALLGSILQLEPVERDNKLDELRAFFGAHQTELTN